MNLNESIKVLQTEKAIRESNLSIGVSTMHDREMVEAIDAVYDYIQKTRCQVKLL